MNKQQMQSAIGNIWFWLGCGLLLIVAVLAIQNVSRPAKTATIPETGGPIPAQSVPEAGVQGVTDYLEAHSDSSAQAVPEAGVQGVSDYLNAHGNPSAQSVPEAGAQSVADYIRLHSADRPASATTDPAVQSVMDYLKAHGIQP
jgi:hypothetical protein